MRLRRQVDLLVTNSSGWVGAMLQVSGSPGSRMRSVVAMGRQLKVATHVWVRGLWHVTVRSALDN